MPEAKGTIFGAKAVEQLRQTVSQVARRIRSETPQRSRFMGERDRRHWAVLQEDLLAAVDFFTDPSTATARLCRRNGDGDYVLTDMLVTVVNRFQNISLDEDTIIGIEWQNGEWTPYKADCSPTSQSISDIGPSEAEPGNPGGGTSDQQPGESINWPPGEPSSESI